MSWVSRLHKYVALSSNATEYVTIIEAGKEMIWMTNYLEEVGKKPREKILYINSQSVIQLVKNSVYHSKIKYIRRQYHFTRRLLDEGDMCFEKKIESSKNPTEMLTKYLDVGKLRLSKALTGRVD